MSDTSISTIGTLQDDQSGPYVLRRLDLDIALSEDESQGDIHITCVEFWEGNLYIGTSAAEVLHYFQLPPADDDDVSQQFILATRLQPHFAENVSPAQRVGVQQILILANVSKACILCNGTLTFYTLPELSPLFTNTKLNNCLSVGGVDEGGVEPGDDNDDGMVIMICQKSRIRLVRIGERLQRVREIEAGGCLDTLRRGSIACVADHKSYYLLDVVERQRIPLFEISSSADDSNAEPDTRSSPQATGELVRPSLAVSSLAPGDTAGQSHSRTVSSASIPQHEEQQPRKSSTQLSHTLEEPPPRRSSLQPPPADASRAHSRTPSQDIASHRTPNILMPHIASPSPSEFLLTTGTSLDEPGVGMFVNSDGDVVRGTLEFSRYPEALCIDGQKAAADEGATEQDQFVLAIVTKIADGQSSKELEIHNLDQSADSVNSGRFNLQVVGDMLASRSHPQNSFGIRPVSSDFELRDSRVRDLLSLKRLTLPNDDEGSGDTTSTNAEREKQEAQFINRLSSTKCKTIVWGIDKLWWTCRNPALVRLHARLQLAMGQFKDSKTGETNRKLVGQVITDIEGEEPTTELEFLTIRLVRQEASLMLFLDVLQQSFNKLRLNERGRNLIEQALSDGEIDPRLVLSVIPALWQEVAQGTNGIWISGALKTLLEDFRSKHDMSQARTIVDLDSPGTKDVLQLVRGYLLLWRLKKGFGSVADEKEVFETVDAALLHVYLLLDGDSPKGPGRRDSTRSELNAVVDSGLDCFDRAVELLEEHRRLYVLSRLYQSRKMSTKVLGTWRRILEGEEDAGGELTDGEQEMRRYLAVVSNPALVEEYGAWLAARNPKIGVRVFADGNSKVKFEPKRAVEILKQHAPNAVKDYLEYLVFDRNLAIHATDLITYYLDSVLNELESSEDSRAYLLTTYASYSALRPPKPTYSQFAADNSLEADWWRNRLRLLQLLGGSHGAASQYDIPGILERIAPFEKELVPETIVLSGRQGKHREAIRLLVHGLGDYDTAIRYCLLGGSGTYSPTSASLPQESIPSHGRQMSLFAYLLEEFLHIQDLDQQITQTSELLERFAGWFDVEQVLASVPDSWSVDKLEVFLMCTMRQLVAERNETAVARALTGVQNLVQNVELVEKQEALGPLVQTEEVRQLED